MAKRSSVVGVEKMLARVRAIHEISSSDAKEIADQVVVEMKKLISKGVSPIQQTGRFEAYKAAGNANASRKEASKARKQAKAFSSDARRLDQMGEGDLAKEARRRASSSSSKASKASSDEAKAKRGYPYSVQGKYPGKKPRPVNLNLSGKFLSDLQGKARKHGSRNEAVVGIYGKLSVLKEKGHREGANGQPSRPIIPDYAKGERFTDVIRFKIERLFKNLVKKNSK